MLPSSLLLINKSEGHLISILFQIIFLLLSFIPSFGNSQTIPGERPKAGQVVYTNKANVFTKSITLKTLGASTQCIESVAGLVTGTGSVCVTLGNNTWTGNQVFTANSTSAMLIEPATTTGYALVSFLNANGGAYGGESYIGQDNSTGAGFDFGDYAFVIYNAAATAMVFANDNNNYMQIAGGGQIGVHTTQATGTMQFGGTCATIGPVGTCWTSTGQLGYCSGAGNICSSCTPC